MIRLLICFVVLFFMVNAQYPDGNSILKKIDENIFSENKIVISRMVIHGRRGSRTIEAKTWQRNALLRESNMLLIPLTL